ncbi:MAG TPA: hypothetical protein VJJ82_01180 [Candidatus Nanoarchaeia archaeon]|nr:hypothetical protein [Candidatus Nanoarchaeia archaeon]
MEFDRTDPDNLDVDGIHHIVELCIGYRNVRLYGCSTNACLPFAKRRLESAGLRVSYDDTGCID